MGMLYCSNNKSKLKLYEIKWFFLIEMTFIYIYIYILVEMKFTNYLPSYYLNTFTPVRIKIHVYSNIKINCHSFFFFFFFLNMQNLFTLP